MSSETALNSQSLSDTGDQDEFHDEIDDTLEEYEEMTSQRKELGYLLRSLESTISRVQPKPEKEDDSEDMKKIERILTSQIDDPNKTNRLTNAAYFSKMLKYMPKNLQVNPYKKPAEQNDTKLDVLYDGGESESDNNSKAKMLNQVNDSNIDAPPTKRKTVRFEKDQQQQ